MPPKTPDAEIFELQARLARLRAYHFGYERQQLPPTAEHWRLRNDIGEEVQQLLQDLFARHAQQARLVRRVALSGWLARLEAHSARDLLAAFASAEDEVPVLRVAAGLKVWAVGAAHDGLGRLTLCEGVRERDLQEAFPLPCIQVRVEGSERDWLGTHAARWREGVGAHLIQLRGAE